MEWYPWDDNKVDWEVKEVGAIWDVVEVLAVWMSAPWDPKHPWRWGVALEGKTYPVGPYTEGRIWAAWGTASGKMEAMELAEERALTLLRALPREWVKIWGEDLPF